CCGAVKLAVLAGRPQYIGGTLVIGIAPGDEQIVRQPGDILQRRLRHTLAWLVLQLDHDAFGTAANCARKVQIGRGGAAAGQYERLWWRELAIEPVYLTLEPSDLRIGHREPGAAGPLLGETEIGLDIKKIALDAAERSIERLIAGDMQADQADHGIDLVDSAIGLDPQIVFLAPGAGA